MAEAIGRDPEDGTPCPDLRHQGCLGLSGYGRDRYTWFEIDALKISLRGHAICLDGLYDSLPKSWNAVSPGPIQRIGGGTGPARSIVLKTTRCFPCLNLRKHR